MSIEQCQILADKVEQAISDGYGAVTIYVRDGKIKYLEVKSSRDLPTDKK